MKNMCILTSYTDLIILLHTYKIYIRKNWIVLLLENVQNQHGDWTLISLIKAAFNYSCDSGIQSYVPQNPLNAVHNVVKQQANSAQVNFKDISPALRHVYKHTKPFKAHYWSYD